MTMELVRRNKSIETADGYKEFWEACQRFFGRNNFSHEEIMGIMHHINSCYFMGLIPNQSKREDCEKTGHFSIRPGNQYPDGFDCDMCGAKIRRFGSVNTEIKKLP